VNFFIGPAHVGLYNDVDDHTILLKQCLYENNHIFTNVYAYDERYHRLQSFITVLINSPCVQCTLSLCLKQQDAIDFSSWIYHNSDFSENRSTLIMWQILKKLSINLLYLRRIFVCKHYIDLYLPFNTLLHCMLWDLKINTADFNSIHTISQSVAFCY